MKAIKYAANFDECFASMKTGEEKAFRLFLSASDNEYYEGRVRKTAGANGEEIIEAAGGLVFHKA